VENVTVVPRVRLLRRRDAPDADADADGDGNCNTNGDSNSTSVTDCYADRNTYFNAHTNRDAETSSSTQTAPEASSSDLPAGYTTASAYTP
jgi:hypothetical protein